jgi:hypothetical protein
MILSGGCQCGAVRFSVDSEALGGHALCHCRMCQKAFSSPYASLICAPVAAVTWTRGAPSHFQSSTKARRGFCSQCGTPLTYEGGGDEIELASIAFDDPNALVPVHQTAYPMRVAWTDQMEQITWRKGEAETYPVVSLQHPDHDTPND